jgi:hypothetical protein
MQDNTGKKNKLIEKLILFFKQPREESKNKVPDGICVNCWGEQEYDNKIRAMYDEKQIDVNHHSANYAFIQKFVVDQLDGIHIIKDDDRLLCPICVGKHKKFPDS